MSNIRTVQLITKLQPKMHQQVYIASPANSLEYQEYLPTDDSDESCDYTGSIHKEVRKRKRLTHLTQDEKLMRRKLKNRVAAQSARDRKKQHMQELEEAIEALKTQNEMLRSENDTLRQCATALTNENKSLRNELTSFKLDSVVSRQPTLESTPGSAVGTDSGEARPADNHSNADLPTHRNHISLVVHNQPKINGIKKQKNEEANRGDRPHLRVIRVKPLSANRPVVSPVVGPTPEELDSLDGLIKIDQSTLIAAFNSNKDEVQLAPSNFQSYNILNEYNDFSELEYNLEINCNQKSTVSNSDNSSPTDLNNYDAEKVIKNEVPDQPVENEMTIFDENSKLNEFCLADDAEFFMNLSNDLQLAMDSTLDEYIKLDEDLNLLDCLQSKIDNSNNEPDSMCVNIEYHNNEYINTSPAWSVESTDSLEDPYANHNDLNSLLMWNNDEIGDIFPDLYNFNIVPVL